MTAELGPSEEAESGPPPAPSPGETLRRAAESFHRVIDGIRELVVLVEPHLQDSGRKLTEAVAALPVRQRIAALIYASWFIGFRIALRDASDAPPAASNDTEDASDTEDTGVTEDARTPMADLGVLNRPNAGEQELAKEEAKELLGLLNAANDKLDKDELGAVIAREFRSDPDAFIRFVELTKRLFSDPNKQLILNQSMLVSAVAAFETLLARVLDIQFRLFPNLLDATDRRFSLSDLQGFATIEDARAAAIQDRVDSLMREDFTEWEAWLDKRAGITLSQLSINRDSLYEVMQRRHLLVHTAGVVSKQYRAKVGASAPSPGTRLVVRSQYLEDALDQLDATGTSLALVAAAKWDPDDAEATVDALLDLSYTLLQNGRFRPVALLSSACDMLPSLAGRHELILRVNGWLARKALDGIESVRDEVEDWDVSALAPEFTIAKAAILGDLDLVVSGVPALLEGKQLRQKDLEEWPLFEGLRKDPRYPALLEQAPDSRRRLEVILEEASAIRTVRMRTLDDDAAEADAGGGGTTTADANDAAVEANGRGATGADIDSA